MPLLIETRPPSISAGPPKGPARAELSRGRRAGVIWPQIPVRCNHSNRRRNNGWEDALPKPAEPKPANRHRQQRKPVPESVPAVNYRKTEKDVAKLIDCLAEWTRICDRHAPQPQKRPPAEVVPAPTPEERSRPCHRRRLPTGESPHRIDGIHGPGRGGLAGIYRERTTRLRGNSGGAPRSTGPSPPLRLPNRVAIHVPRACGLAVPGGSPTPIPLGRGPTRPTSGRDNRLAGASPFQPWGSGDRVVHWGRRIGSWGDRGLVPRVAADSESERGNAP